MEQTFSFSFPLAFALGQSVTFGLAGQFSKLLGSPVVHLKVNVRH